MAASFDGVDAETGKPDWSFGALEAVLKVDELLPSLLGAWPVRAISLAAASAKRVSGEKSLTLMVP